MKKTLSLILTFILAFAFVSCGKTEETDTTDSSTETSGYINETAPAESESADDTEPASEQEAAEAVTEASSEAADEASKNAVTDKTESETAKEGTTRKKELLFKDIEKFYFDEHDPDPKNWTVEEIIACYKSGMASEDHADVKTDQKFELLGELPGPLEGPVKLAMKLAAQPYNALCGGYWDIQPSDLKNADAHKEGDYIVINLYPKEQTDGPNGNEHEGTVGHVVNVVQGIDEFIGFVEENFSVLNAKYDDDSVVLKYTDAYAKNVKINTKTGKMESGTWGYTLEIYLDHCSMAGVKFDNFHTTIGWTCWYPAD